MVLGRTKPLLACVLVVLIGLPVWAAGHASPVSLPQVDAAATAPPECVAPGVHDAVAVDWTPAHEAAAVLDPATGVDDVLLWRLHKALSHLPGFVDIHFVLDGPPRFVAWFEGAAPPVLPDIDAPYPVTPMTMDAQPLMGRAALDLDGPMAAGITEASLVEADAEAAPPLVPEACIGLRPGKGLNQGSCTVAWMVQGSDGKTYAVSAGHCVGAVGSWVGYGWVRYKRDAGVGFDFTVIEIVADRVPDVSPSMCHWGGPTGSASSGGVGRATLQYGMGFVLGQTHFTRPRPGALWGFGATSYSMWGPQINGDSGSPVRLESGPALGVHTHGLGLVLFGTGLGFGTRLSHGFNLAEGNMGIDLQLLTAPEA